MDYARKAKDLLTHYFALSLRGSGLSLGNDGIAEISSIVDLILRQAEEDRPDRLLEKALWEARTARADCKELREQCKVQQRRIVDLKKRLRAAGSVLEDGQDE